MEQVRYKGVFLSLFAGLVMVLFATLSFAEEAKSPAGGAEPPKADAPAVTPAAPGAPAAAAPAPKLPTYFTATSADPKKPPPCPDPTGANSGVWATPAGDGHAHIPEDAAVRDGDAA